MAEILNQKNDSEIEAVKTQLEQEINEKSIAIQKVEDLRTELDEFKEQKVL